MWGCSGTKNCLQMVRTISLHLKKPHQLWPITNIMLIVLFYFCAIVLAKFAKIFHHDNASCYKIASGKVICVKLKQAKAAWKANIFESTVDIKATLIALLKLLTTVSKWQVRWVGLHRGEILRGTNANVSVTITHFWLFKPLSYFLSYFVYIH